MKPKEKAEELFTKYNEFNFETIVESTQRTKAKQCALIAVEEILNDAKGGYDDIIITGYWSEVKQEIEKL